MRRYFNLFFCMFTSLQLCLASDHTVFVAEIPFYTPFRTETVTIDLKDTNYPVPASLPRYKIAADSWRGKFVPYTNIPSPIKRAQVAEQIQESENAIAQYWELFRNEAFGRSSQESQLMTDKQLRMVVLANRMKSIFPYNNRSLKYLESINDQCLVLRGFWEPKWTVLSGNIYVPASLKDVRQFMYYCWRQANNQHLSETDQQKYRDKVARLIKEENLVGKIKEVRKKTNGRQIKVIIEANNNHVPYNHLREYLRTAPNRATFIQNFCELAKSSFFDYDQDISQKVMERLKDDKELSSHIVPKITLYEALHDSDIVGLRVKQDGDDNTIGLYSHYLQLLDNSDTPIDVITTGYRLFYDQQQFKDSSNYRILYSLIEEDRYARAAAARVDARAAYIPEPNCLFLVPEDQLMIPESFLMHASDDKILPLSDKEFQAYDPRESLVILQQLQQRKENFYVSFDPTRPIWMKTPPRMLENKKSKSAIDFSKCYVDIHNHIMDLDELRALSKNIAQSTLNFRDYPIILYSQLNFKGCGYDYKSLEITNADTKFTSLVCTILKYYMTEVFSLKAGLKDASNNLFTETLRRIDETQKILSQKAAAVVRLVNTIYGQEIGFKCISIGQAYQNAREEHYKEFFDDNGVFADIAPAQAGVAGAYPTRLLPSRAIELSQRMSRGRGLFYHEHENGFMVRYFESHEDVGEYKQLISYEKFFSEIWEESENSNLLHVPIYFDDNVSICEQQIIELIDNLGKRPDFSVALPENFLSNLEIHTIIQGFHKRQREKEEQEEIGREEQARAERRQRRQERQEELDESNPGAENSSVDTDTSDESDESDENDY